MNASSTREAARLSALMAEARQDPQARAAFLRKYLDDQNAAAGRTVAVPFPVGYSSRAFQPTYEAAASQIGHRPAMSIEHDRSGALVAMTTPADREVVEQIIATVAASA